MGAGKIVSDAVSSALGVSEDLAGAFASDNMTSLASVHILGDALCMIASGAFVFAACVFFAKFARRHGRRIKDSGSIPRDVAWKSALLLSIMICAAAIFMFVAAWSVADIIGWSVSPNAMLLDSILRK